MGSPAAEAQASVVFERQPTLRGSFSDPGWKGLLLLQLLPCHAWVNVPPGLGPTCQWSCRGPCLPEGPPVLLLVFRGQPEAPLTPWLLAALLSTWSWLGASSSPVGVLRGNVALLQGLWEPWDCSRGCPELRRWIIACRGDLVAERGLGSVLTPL